MQKLLKNKVLRFLIIGGGSYIIWLLIYSLLIKEYTNWDYYLNYNIVQTGQEIFSWFGVQTYIDIESDHVVLVMDYTNHISVFVGDECNGFKLFSLFTIFIIAFPGPVKKKLWFIPMGIIFIQIANIIRVMLLLAIFNSYPDALDFNHKYTFTIFVYAIIFALWWWWAKKYSEYDKKN